VAVDHALDDRQPNAHAGKFILGVRALECAEELSRALHVEAHSVITDELDPVTIALLGTKLDPGFRVPAGELPGIAQQVAESQAQQAFVASGDEAFVHIHTRSMGRVALLQLLGCWRSRRRLAETAKRR